MTLTRWNPTSALWDPFASLADIQAEMNRLFESSRRRFDLGTYDGGFVPPVDVIEEADTLWVRMDLPGCRKEDVTVTLQDNLLTIKGERRQEAAGKEASYYRQERVYGPFTRAIELPMSVDAGHIDAHFRDGVLHVKLPKTEEARPKQIEVKVG
jgi:HSP20 family protein